ncbi:MAG: hypothetical protein Q4D27_04075 [Coriobacteriia bacterium]|nr:hypothetical protein [Coriobacteriia bacterium]
MPVMFRERESCFHGFDLVRMGKPVAKDATGFMMGGFKYVVANYFVP